MDAFHPDFGIDNYLFMHTVSRWWYALVVEKCVHRQGHAFQLLGVGKSTTYEPVSFKWLQNANTCVWFILNLIIECILDKAYF